MLPNTHFARPRYFRLLLASSLALNALALALPLMTMQIYDRVLSNRAEGHAARSFDRRHHCGLHGVHAACVPQRRCRPQRRTV